MKKLIIFKTKIELLSPSLGQSIQFVSEQIVVNLKNIFLAHTMYQNPGKSKQFHNSCIKVNVWIIEDNGPNLL
jgi:hypothetical protein